MYAGPYPFVGANLLKLFADAQVFVVALVGLVLRINPETLDKEGLYNRDFYGNVMLGLLVGTLVPATGTLLYRSPVERALMKLQEIAKSLPDLPQAPNSAGGAPKSLGFDSDGPQTDAKFNECQSETKPSTASTRPSSEESIDVEAGSTMAEGVPPAPDLEPNYKQRVEFGPEAAPEPELAPKPHPNPELQLEPDRGDDQFVSEQSGETDVAESSVVTRQFQPSSVFSVSTSSGGPATVKVKVRNTLNPDVITTCCPEQQFRTGSLLYVTAAGGEEFEIPIPDELETDDEFDVDMGDLSDEGDA